VVAETPKLKSLERHEAFQKKFREKIQKQQHMQAAKRQFKALPAPKATTVAMPHRPVAKTIPLQLSTPMLLASDRRAKDREAFDAKQQEMRKKREAEMAKEAAVVARQEELLEREIRSNQIFRATPLAQFKRFHLQPSVKALTVPKSPRLGPQKRINNNHKEK
jgi:hypothetical protein